MLQLMPDLAKPRHLRGDAKYFQSRTRYVRLYNIFLVALLVMMLSRAVTKAYCSTARILQLERVSNCGDMPQPCKIMSNWRVMQKWYPNC